MFALSLVMHSNEEILRSSSLKKAKTRFPKWKSLIVTNIFHPEPGFNYLYDIFCLLAVDTSTKLCEDYFDGENAKPQ